MMRNGLVFAIALLLAGCAGLRIAGVPDGALQERQVIELIDYAQRVAAMTAEQQRIEFGARSQGFAKENDTMNRMRLALLHALPGASFHDAARAASLLEPMTAPDQGASPLRSFARLLHAQLDDSAQEHKRARQMREQLDALKAVERTIMERGQESQPRRR